MDLRVDPADVRRASQRYLEVVDGLGKPTACSQATTDRVGHVEVTDWIANLRNDLAEARRTLATGTAKLANSLCDAASAIQEADQDAGDDAYDIERGIEGSGPFGQRVPAPAVWGSRRGGESSDLLGRFDDTAPTPKPKPMPAEWNDGSLSEISTDGGGS